MLAAVGVAPMRKGTLTAGFEVILNLKPLSLVVREYVTRLSKQPNRDGLG